MTDRGSDLVLECLLVMVRREYIESDLLTLILTWDERNRIRMGSKVRTESGLGEGT